MPTLINTQTQQPEERSYDTMQSDLLGGTHNLPQGAQVNMLDPDGKPVSIPAEEAYNAFQEGYKIPSQQAVDSQLHEQDLDSQYGPGAANSLKAAALGAARGATFGASDLIATKSGMISPTTINELRNRHEIASPVGEMAGIGASLLTGEGAPSLLAKATGAISENPVVRQALTKYGAGALGSAVEGAAYGAGNLISEQALGDTDLNSEKILSQLGAGAILGGVLGGGFTAMSDIVPAAVNKAKDILGKSSSLAPGFSKASSLVSGNSVDDIMSAINTRGDALSAKESQKLVGELRTTFQDQYNTVNKALKDSYSDIRDVETSSLLDASHLPKAQAELSNVAGKFDDAIKEIHDSPALYQNRYAVKLSDIKQELMKADSNNAAAIFEAVDDAKHLIDGQLKYGKVITPELSDSINLLRNLRSELKSSLENESIFGAAASRQSAFNEANANFQNLQKQVQKDFMVKTVSKDGKAVFKIDQVKVARAIKDPNKYQNLVEYQAASRDVIDQVERTYQAVPSQKFDSESLKSLVEKNTQSQATLQKGMAHQASLNGLGGEASGLTESGLVLGAAHFLGPVGAAVAAGYNVLKNPGVTVQRLAALERLLNKGSLHIEKLSKDIFTPITKGIKATAYPISDAAVDSYISKIQKASQDPSHLIDRMTAATGTIDHAAPELTQGIHSKVTSVVDFLASKLPKTAPIGPLDHKTPLSDSQKSHFMRYQSIVENPYRALEQLRQGTLTPATIETLSTVYPKLYNEMKLKVKDEMFKTASKKNAIIPYRTKLMLSSFLGEPVTSTISPMSMSLNQHTLQGNTQQTQQMGAVKPSQAGMSKIDLSSRMATEMRDSLTRKAR
jgi:hypothetical protein